MTWILLVVIVVVMGILALSGAKDAPWVSKLRRVNAGAAGRAEWLAPDGVILQVQQDYLRAREWLQQSLFESWSHQWTTAPAYFAGAQLKRHQTILTRYRAARAPRCLGVLYAEHRIAVRHFSDDGRRCLVIDHQSQLRMVTHDYRTHKRLAAQSLADTTVVYQMVYDHDANRWKIEAFIQELPIGWHNPNAAQHIQPRLVLPDLVGRDH